MNLRPSVADLRSKILDVPSGSKFFQFHAVFGTIWQNRMLTLPGGLAAPPWGNPGSATVRRIVYIDLSSTEI